MTFPSDFLWGVAASAYQIEGAATIDGRGPSIWDAFCHTPGATKNADTADVACDHYHRYEDDVALMGELGVGAYRLSVSWPRVLPGGVGRVNEKGLGFYDRLVDALLARGIEPWVTLFHWDYPAALQERGGWLAPESPEWFAEYTRVVVERLSDRVTRWMTINEPQVYLGAGHLIGVHPPGLKLERPELLRVIHRALLAHGRAVRTIREHAKKTPSVGWAPVFVTHHPATDDPADVEAARARTFCVPDVPEWTFSNTWYMDPVFLGRYPEEGLARFGADMARVSEEEMRTINQPLDFSGANTYFGTSTRVGPGGVPVEARLPEGHGVTMMQWPVTPEALYWGPRFMHERYGVPLFITENGMAAHDWLHTDGAVHDPSRIDFLRRYLLQLRRARGEGVDVRGYFQWSFMDNFEWTEGYAKRFGLVFVDYATQRRIPKDSFGWYRRVIATNGGALDGGDGMQG